MVQQTTNDEKPVLIEISEKLWLRAKACAAISDLPIKDLVALALEAEIQKRNHTIQ